MSTLRRSATGCTRCKTRRKKCDETKPECLRCLSSGNPCNYEYIEYPESDAYRVIRTKPAPRSARELLARASRNLPTRVSVTAAFVSSDSGDSTVLLRPVADQPHINEIGVHRISTDSGLILYNPSVPLLTSSDLVQGPDVVQHTHDTDPITSGSASQVTANRNPGERTQMLLYTAPTVDRNIEQNALPFVLQCYAQWAAAVIFEPSKIMPAMRDRVFAQFACENKRTNSILIANVMNMFVKGLATNRARTPILDQLASSVQTNGAVFIASPPSPVPALERQNAANILDNMLEIITLLIHTRPSSEFTQLLQGAAGVFRRACPGPPGRPVNLSAVLLDFNINLRHFATIDIVKHIATGLPTCFLYEVPFSLELCDRIYHLQLQGNYGLQWVYGIPDQFILLIAWINTLSQTLDDDDQYSELVAWVEQVLPQIKVAIDDLGDPALHMVNLGIFESWRLTVQIYLYMVLCKADAHDPRVVQTQRSFMRLIRGIKPGRHPDVYLILQIGMVGIVTVEERHRGVLLRRILGVQGYAEKGTAPNDTLLILKDIWARTKDEGRAAVWSDLRIGYSRLRGG